MVRRRLAASPKKDHARCHVGHYQQHGRPPHPPQEQLRRGQPRHGRCQQEVRGEEDAWGRGGRGLVREGAEGDGGGMGATIADGKSAVTATRTGAMRGRVGGVRAWRPGPQAVSHMGKEGVSWAVWGGRDRWRGLQTRAAPSPLRPDTAAVGVANLAVACQRSLAALPAAAAAQAVTGRARSGRGGGGGQPAARHAWRVRARIRPRDRAHARGRARRRGAGAHCRGSWHRTVCACSGWPKL